MPITGVLLLLFIILKCTGHIDWPWPVVLIPMYVHIVLLVLEAAPYLFGG